MATGASQIFVEQVRQAAEILGLGGGGDPKLFALITMSAPQSFNLNAGDHVELDTIFQETSGGSGITVSTGVQQANGLVTLPQGHLFKVSGYFNATKNAASTFVIHRFRNNTDAVLFGAEARSIVNTNSDGSETPIGYIDTTAEAKEIEWRLVSETGLIQITSNLSGNGQTYIVVEEV